MTQIKDDLGREFVALPALSTILNLSTKQVRRHIRNKRMISIKQGQHRYILKDDILREYSDLSPERLNRDIRDISRDTIGTSVIENDVPDVQSVPDVPFNKEINLYEKDQKTDIVLSQIEQVKTVISRLEKSIADVGYIQQDTKTLDRKLDRITAKMSQIEGQKRHLGHKIYVLIVTIIVLGVIGAGIYGVDQFKQLYFSTQENYNTQIKIKDKELSNAAKTQAETIRQYEKETREKELNIEKMKVKLDQQAQQISFMQEALITEKNQNSAPEQKETDGYQNTEIDIQTD